MPFDAAPIAIKTRTDCLLCPINNCLGRKGNADAANTWASILGPRASLMPGESLLFSLGDAQRGLYSVRAGCIKTYTIDADGNERIRGFHLPGDLIGLDALGSGRMQSSAAAVEPSQVCVAPIGQVQELIGKQPEIARRLMEQTCRELTLALAMSGDYSAEQRVAAFLIYLNERLHSPSGLLRLPMSQRDIGNYLRLAPETVCRIIKGFAKKGWLRAEEKGLRLLSHPGMYALAEAVGICAAPVQQRMAA